MSDQRNLAAEAIYNAMLEAQRDVGDVALCEALDLLAVDTGQNKFRHAAAVVRGTKLGRTATDDRAAIQRIVAFPPAHRREAVGIVACDMAKSEPGSSADSIARRLRRKLRNIQNETDELVKSVAAGS